MNNMTDGQKIAVGGGIALFVASFLPWYSAFGFSINGWDSQFWAVFGILLGLAGAIVIALKAFGVTDLKLGDFAAEQIALILTGASVVFILLRLLTESSSVSYGLFLALLAAAAAAFGCYKAMKDAGLDLPGKGPGSTPGGPTA